MPTVRKSLSAIVASTLMLAMVANLTACGTIIHPERKGQRGGNIDAGIAVLDAVGLLFFIIPGVIAFAVDFSNGTIYLPHGRSSALEDPHKYSEIHFNNQLDVSTVESIISAKTGTVIDLHQANVQVVKMENLSDLDTQFAQYETDQHVAMAQ